MLRSWIAISCLVYEMSRCLAKLSPPDLCSICIIIYIYKLKANLGEVLCCHITSVRILSKAGVEGELSGIERSKQLVGRALEEMVNSLAQGN